MVEVAGDLQAAFLAIGSVTYTERLLHAGLESPGVESVLAARVAKLGPGRGCSGCRRGGRRAVGIHHAGIGVGVGVGVGVGRDDGLDIGMNGHGTGVGGMGHVRQIWPL